MCNTVWFYLYVHPIYQWGEAEQKLQLHEGRISHRSGVRLHSFWLSVTGNWVYVVICSTYQTYVESVHLTSCYNVVISLIKCLSSTHVTMLEQGFGLVSLHWLKSSCSESRGSQSSSSCVWVSLLPSHSTHRGLRGRVHTVRGCRSYTVCHYTYYKMTGCVCYCKHLMWWCLDARLTQVCLFVTAV